MSITIRHKKRSLKLRFLSDIIQFFAMVFFAAAIGKFVVTAGPQVFVFNGLCMGCVGVFRQFFNNFGRYACYQGVRRNDGVFGYNRAGCHNGAFADNSAVQYGGVHADKHMVFNRAGVQKRCSGLRLHSRPECRHGCRKRAARCYPEHWYICQL